MRVPRAIVLLLAALAALAACDRRTDLGDVHVPPPPGTRAVTDPPATASAQALPSTPDAAPPIKGLGPGFPTPGPWVSFYGRAAQMGDLAKVAARYRIINIDADPRAANFTVEQLQTLKAGGKNRVLSYMNVGACETHREYWSKVPAGLVSCARNSAAQLGAYDGYPDETWMDPGNADYQRLVLEHVAPRLAARGIDGFYLDNLEILDHGEATKNGPCGASCRQGGLDLVRKLREKYPGLLLVMQNGTGDVARLGTTGGIPYPALLDGVAHEEVYAPRYDAQAERELLAWKALPFEGKNGRALWIAVEDYVGSCKNAPLAAKAMARAAEHGFASYVSDESAGQHVVCFW